MEIERKFLLRQLPAELENFPCQRLVQGYLCTAPVVRVRREGDAFFLTYKSGGLLAREEYNLPLTEEAFLHLLSKCDGLVIQKARYRIPLPDGHTAELDVFDPPIAPLRMVEVEFASLEDAEAFTPPEWFGEEVTNDPAYHNSNMSRQHQYIS